QVTFHFHPTTKRSPFFRTTRRLLNSGLSTWRHSPQRKLQAVASTTYSADRTTGFLILNIFFLRPCLKAKELRLRNHGCHQVRSSRKTSDGKLPAERIRIC